MKVRKIGKPKKKTFVGDIAVNNAVVNNFNGNPTLCSESKKENGMKVLKESIDGKYSEKMFLLINKCEEEKDDYIYYIARRLTQYMSESDIKDMWEHYKFDKIYEEFFPKKNDSIQDWYLTVYYTDDLGEDIDEDATFAGLYDALKQGKDIYDYIGVSDSIIRERVERELIDRYKISREEAEKLFN